MLFEMLDSNTKWTRYPVLNQFLSIKADITLKL